MTGRIPRTADAILALLSETPGEWLTSIEIGMRLYQRGNDVRVETRRRVLRELTGTGRIESRVIRNGPRLEHRVLASPLPAATMTPIPRPERPRAPEARGGRYRVIRWQEPPPPKSVQRVGPYATRSRFDALAAELRDHRGLSAVIYEGERSEAMGLASGIRRATTKCWQPIGSFQATARSEYGKYVVYARYVG